MARGPLLTGERLRSAAAWAVAVLVYVVVIHLLPRDGVGAWIRGAFGLVVLLGFVALLVESVQEFRRGLRGEERRAR